MRKDKIVRMAMQLMASYSTTVNGIPVTSNVPTGTSPGPGHYTITLTFTIPIVNILAQYGADILDDLDPSAFASAVNAQTGSTISNFQTSTSGNALVINFDATSPPVAIVAAVIIGLLSVLAYIVYNIAVVVTPAVAPITNWLIPAVVLIGGGVVIYALLTSSKTRGAATQAVTKGFSTLATL